MRHKTRIGLLAVLLLLGVLLAACGGGEAAEPEPLGDPVLGKEQFDMVCIACHGEGGVGIEGLGKDMTSSEFIASQTDLELLEFVKTGRPIDDPLNTTGVDMPPKGGNPALTDDDILNIIAYIRSIQQ